MTPPLPPDGYELVDDEPRKGDAAWLLGQWYLVDLYFEIGAQVEGKWIHARDLRWIARKK